jgi:hypothetical protein
MKRHRMLTPKEFHMEVFSAFPSVRYEHTRDCLEALACDCIKPSGHHTSRCASLQGCECNGKYVGLTPKVK